MPFYEYRPLNSDCEICGGCFVDLQKMSDEPHKSCPDCGKKCERVLSAPMVSVRGSEFKAAENKENRAATMARVVPELGRLRESALKKTGQIPGHTHNCALAGCFGRTDESDKSVSSEGSSDEQARRFGSLPHLVGGGKK